MHHLVKAHPRSSVWVDDGVPHWPIVRPVDAVDLIANAPADMLTSAEVAQLEAALRLLARVKMWAG